MGEQFFVRPIGLTDALWSVEKVVAVARCGFGIEAFRPASELERLLSTDHFDKLAVGLPDGQITSDFQKPCQALETKIFLFFRN